MRLFFDIPNLWSKLRAELRAELGSNLRSNLEMETWEYYEFIWPVFIRHFYTNLPTITKRSKTIAALDHCITSGIGHLWLSSTTMYAIPFPKISVDSEKRLHCENGPACEWVGKRKSWWIHGVRVTRKIVETPDRLTKKDWIGEQNLEVRRIIQDQMGERFLTEVGGKEIGSDEFGKLFEVELPNDPEKVARYCMVPDRYERSWLHKCWGKYRESTRSYAIRVPPSIQTCHEGLAWSWDEKLEDYYPTYES